MMSLLGAVRLRPCRVRMGHADCQHANQTAGQFPTGHLKSISHFMQDQLSRDHITGRQRETMPEIQDVTGTARENAEQNPLYRDPIVPLFLPFSS